MSDPKERKKGESYKTSAFAQTESVWVHLWHCLDQENVNIYVIAPSNPPLEHKHFWKNMETNIFVDINSPGIIRMWIKTFSYLFLLKMTTF